MNSLDKFKKQNGLTDAQLSQSLGISIIYLRKLRYGERKPTKRVAEALERVTGIDRRAWLWPEEFHNPYLSKDAAPCAGCEEQHG